MPITLYIVFLLNLKFRAEPTLGYRADGSLPKAWNVGYNAILQNNDTR